MIIIPMAAGRSDRFREAGYTKPKFMLTWRRKSLFFHALDSFRACFTTERFLIVLQDRENTLSFVERELLLLGIPQDRVTIVTLENATKGQAETVAVGLRKAKVPSNVPLTIFGIDAFRKGFVHPRDFDSSSVDGYLEVSSKDGEDRAFVRPAPDRADERKVAEISEKNRISDLRCTGLYHFHSCELYLSLYAEVERLHPGESQDGDLRVAPLYDRAIRRGADIRYVRISSDDVRFFGTPSEYEQTLDETPSDKRFAFCIGGQIRSDRRHLEAIADLARRHEADVYISAWRKRGRKTLHGPNWAANKIRLIGQPAVYFLPNTTRLFRMFPKVEQLLAASASEDCSTELMEIFPNAVIDIEEEDTFGFDMPGPVSPVIGDKQCMKMLYKIWRCNRLKRAGESVRGRKYEGVIRMRPDIIPSLKIFTTTEMKHDMAIFQQANHLNDLFWLCSSETDDKISSLFGRIITAPKEDWKGIHEELESWIKRFSLTVKRDRLKVDRIKSAPPQEQSLARSLICEALRNDQYPPLADLIRDNVQHGDKTLVGIASADPTPDDLTILADLIECSGDLSVDGLTMDGLRSMHSTKRALIVVRGILISALLISKPPYDAPALHHCAALVLLVVVAESGCAEIRPEIKEYIRWFKSFASSFREVTPNAKPLLQNVSDTKSESSLGELVWTIHRDLLERLGEERFLMIARSIRACS